MEIYGILSCFDFCDYTTHFTYTSVFIAMVPLSRNSHRFLQKDDILQTVDNHGHFVGTDETLPTSHPQFSVRIGV